MLLLLLIMLCPRLEAQTSDYRTDKLETLRMGTGEIVMGKRADGPAVVGSSFLYDHWIPSSFLTFDERKYDNVKLNYNVEANAITAMQETDNKEYYLATSKIKEFSMMGRRFINVGALQSGLSRETGYVEEVASGPYVSFFKKHFTETLKPTYKEGLNMGTKDFRMIKKSELVIYINHQLVELPAKKRDFLNLFAEKADAVEAHLKTAKLNYKSEADLKKLAIFVNSLN